MQPSLSAAPHRRVWMGGQPWLLVADTRAVYHLELLTGRSYCATIKRFLDRKRKKLQPSVLLLWALSARHREQNRLDFPLSDQDRAVGALVPQAFVELVKLSEFGEFEQAILQLLLEAGLANWVPVGESNQSQDPIRAPVQSTGAEESSISPVSSNSEP